MGADIPLFKTPSLEAHLIATATATLDAALAQLNAADRIASDPGGFAVLTDHVGDERGLDHQTRPRR